MSFFLVAFQNGQGEIDSEVIALRRGTVSEITFALMGLPAMSLMSWSFLSDGETDGPLPYETVMIFMAGGKQGTVVFTHDDPITTTEEVRDVEQTIQESLGVADPVRIVRCEPMWFVNAMNAAGVPIIS